jgi:hypothetical protein
MGIVFYCEFGAMKIKSRHMHKNIYIGMKDVIIKYLYSITQSTIAIPFISTE